MNAFKISILASALALSAAVHAGIVGQWYFDGTLAGSVGSVLAPSGTFAYESGTIAGGTATYLKYTAGSGVANDPYLTVTNGIGGNGGGAKTNQYSLIMDVLLPSNPAGDGYISLLQTGASANASDGDWFIRSDGGMGISGDYADSGNPLVFDRGIWRRIALTIDTGSGMGAGSVYRSYIDGVLQNTVQSPSGWGVDGRFSLGSAFHLFADEDREVNPESFINSLQLRDYAMTANEVAALGGATANGIAPVPEPATTAALLIGLPALAARRKRRG